MKKYKLKVLTPSQKYTGAGSSHDNNQWVTAEFSASGFTIEGGSIIFRKDQLMSIQLCLL